MTQPAPCRDSFPKGPLFTLSTRLARELLGSEQLRHEWNQTEAAARERAGARGGRRRGEAKGLMAWEVRGPALAPAGYPGTPPESQTQLHRHTHH